MAQPRYRIRYQWRFTFSLYISNSPELKEIGEKGGRENDSNEKRQYLDPARLTMHFVRGKPSEVDSGSHSNT
jgi:hypothetical protein